MTKDARRIWSPMRLTEGQHAVIAGHRILRFLTKMTPSSWIFWASSNTSQWKQTPRMMTTILRGFFEHVLRHIHALDCTSRFIQGNKWKIISSFFRAGSGCSVRFRVRSHSWRACLTSVEFCEPQLIKCSRSAASEWRWWSSLSFNPNVFLCLDIIFQFTLSSAPKYILWMRFISGRKTDKLIGRYYQDHHEYMAGISWKVWSLVISSGPRITG